jgi:hypothetical protein
MIIHDVTGKSVDQAVSHRHLKAEAWFRPTHSMWGQVILKAFRFSCRYHSTVALHTLKSPGGWRIGPLVAAVLRHSLTPSTWTTTVNCRPSFSEDAWGKSRTISTRITDDVKKNVIWYPLNASHVCSVIVICLVYLICLVAVWNVHYYTNGLYSSDWNTNA